MPWLLPIAALVAGLAAWRLALAFSRPTSRFYLSDQPNHRSLHASETSRSGGLAVLAGLAMGLLVGFPAFVAESSAEMAEVVPAVGALFLGALLLGIVSWVDDRNDLSPGIRLAAHFLVALAILPAGLAPTAIDLPGLHLPAPPWSGEVLGVLLVVWFINLYNFMDGMDGFCGGMTVIGFGAIAVLAAHGGQGAMGAFGLLIAAAAGGFLIVNWPPARIFMGDTGASVLGYLAGVMCLSGPRADIFPLWVGLLIFSPFVVDATYTLLKRALRGEAVWRSHHSHCYQRLVRLGWGHRRTVLWEYVLMLACAVSALVASSAGSPVGAVLLGGWALAYTALIAMVSRMETGKG